MTRRDRDREMIRRVLTHRDRDREGKIGQPDCNFPPSAGSRVRRDGYAAHTSKIWGLSQKKMFIGFSPDINFITLVLMKNIVIEIF